MKPTIIIETHKDWALTRTEMRVIGYLWQGLELNRIARKMNLDYHTVGWYATRIYKKLGVHRRNGFHKLAGFHSHETGHEVIG